MSTLIKRTPVTRILFFMAADAFFAAASLWTAFWLRFDGHIPDRYFPFLYELTVTLVIIVLAVFLVRRMYAFSWSYVSASEAVSVTVSAVIAYGLFALAVAASGQFPQFTDFPRAVIVTSFLLFLISCAALRFAKRIWLHSAGSLGAGDKARTLIVGAGDAGEQIARSMKLPSSPSVPVGFVDDSAIKQGVTIHGLRVVGELQELPDAVRLLGATEVAIALPSAGKQVIQRAVDLARKAGIKNIKITPSLSDIVQGKVSVKNLKSVQIEDLLGREPVSLDKKQVERFIESKTVLVTGAAGSIGSELVRKVAAFSPRKIILLDQDESGIFSIAHELSHDYQGVPFSAAIADVHDRGKINSIFQEHRPDIVFHAAAYKHVPLMEQAADEAVKNNVFGTKQVAEAALEYGAEAFVFISTDKAVNPTSVMGATKRLGEMICRQLNKQNKTKFIAVRFGNVLNSRGSVIPVFKEQIRKGGPVEVTDPEMKRYFMLTAEACLLVLQAAAMGKGGEVFVLDMGKPVKILDLARDMIRLSGFEPDKDMPIVFTGIRPGEKLFEELLGAEEGTQKTEHKKIFSANLEPMNEDQLMVALQQLEQAVLAQDGLAVVTALQQALPQYHPNR